LALALRKPSALMFDTSLAPARRSAQASCPRSAAIIKGVMPDRSAMLASHCPSKGTKQGSLPDKAAKAKAVRPLSHCAFTLLLANNASMH
jgi:hypothetical protein